MSVSKLSSEIMRFISSGNPEIVCIKGKWGVGKTYAWRKFLKEAHQQKSIGLKQYSYVSLFGRNSLTDLRNAVVENSISTDDLDAKPSLTSLEQAAHVFRQGLNRAGFLTQYLPKSDKYADGIQRVMFLLARNKIVCLDDLERAGSGLNIKDVLGLASQLKDEKGCKVIILLNDEKLEDTQKIDFEDQLEKVADIIFSFDPSPEEALLIALTTEGDFKEFLAENCKKLKINNIRAIKNGILLQSTFRNIRWIRSTCITASHPYGYTGEFFKVSAKRCTNYRIYNEIRSIRWLMGIKRNQQAQRFRPSCRLTARIRFWQR
ncbi:P-loop NTPase fold protein [Methylobacterium sp. R2-1]|uniref:P-loop NTPase fold protein n=1 Tax=Methylobacterium sp. R2-1 TaxID=2587064 RepID=UPI00160B21E9|nr:P-loop NTPase fold protein [Methylobacterium sp. R2-1]MBB2964394.1 hypothetical protein [Methylobacterium sp. R2-1]